MTKFYVQIVRTRRIVGLSLLVEAGSGAGLTTNRLFPSLGVEAAVITRGNSV